MAEENSLSNHLYPLIEALLFIGSVYLEKKTRKFLHWDRSYKQISRISFVTVLTLFLVIFNYESSCKDSGISFAECMYFNFDFSQCIRILVLNSILFGYHIYCKARRSGLITPFYSESWMRTLIFAPLLEQILFRSVFYRSSSGTVSYLYISLLFSLSHLHRPIRKFLKGKNVKMSSVLVHLLLTFILAVYSSYFLSYFKSVIPSILLHAYCNYLGQPQIRNSKYRIITDFDLKMHGVCLVGFIIFFIWFI